MSGILPFIYIVIIVFIISGSSKKAKKSSNTRSSATQPPKPQTITQNTKPAAQFRKKVQETADDSRHSEVKDTAGSFDSKAFEVSTFNQNKWDPVAAEKRAMRRRDGRKPYDPDITGQVKGLFR